MKMAVFSGGMKHGEEMRLWPRTSGGTERYPDAHVVSDAVMTYHYRAKDTDEKGRVIFALVSCEPRTDRWMKR